MPLYAAPLGLSAAMTGFIASFYFYAYGAMQPVCGVLLDKFGPMSCFYRAVYYRVGRIYDGFQTDSFHPFSVAASMDWAFTIHGSSGLSGCCLSFDSLRFYSGITLATGNMGTVVGVAPLGTAIDTWGMPVVSTFLAIFCLFFPPCCF